LETFGGSFHPLCREDFPMSYRVFACSLLALATLPLAAQERPAAEPNRGAYVVKYAAAKDLAGLLAVHFKGAAEIQAGPEGTSNCLLINAPPAVFKEIIKAVELLDRRPQSVAIDVFVIELVARKADDKNRRPDEMDFSGTIPNVVDRLATMQKTGQVAGFKRIQLTTLAGQPATLMLGESKPFVAASTVTATGLARRSIMYRSLGTQVKVTPRLAADKTVTLDLNVENSRSRASATATVGQDEKGNPIPATEFLQSNLATKVSVASGQAALAKNAEGTSKDGETLIVVGARVIEP
jgi:type II secretory pathway component GspD/PulD (secretin)